jgi:tRNA threonylcarbamoyladenosine biosynthesis protein TsaB
MNAGSPLDSQGPRLLAFDTSTDRLSVGVAHGDRVWLHEGAGGAQASTTLIPVVLQLLADAGLQLKQLDAIAFGRGPGSFTGLRTACSVAQGLALGAGVPVLPIDTLLAVAEEARANLPTAESEGRLTALLDARMDEMYAQHFGLQAGVLTALGPASLLKPEALSASLAESANAAATAASTDHWLAGNVFEPYAGRLPAWPASHTVRALPTAAALLRLAPALLAASATLPAAQALPLYVRNKVAQTTAERMQAKEAAQAAQATP